MFFQAIANGFRNYVNFQTRSSRAEYWYWILFTFLIGIVLGIPRGILVATQGPASAGASAIGVVTALFQLATVLPSISVTARRLHDTGRSGWWMLIGITIIGIIPLLIWYCEPGKPGENKYGRNPLEPAVEDVF